MAAKRIIPCLDIRGGRVVKGKNFKDIKDIADPAELARRYNADGAHELAFYDIAASLEGRTLYTELLERVAAEVSIPLIAGGGVWSTDDCERVLERGADKLSINAGALARPDFIDESASRFGSQRVILSMDVKRVGGKFHVFAKGGMEDTGIEAAGWAREGQERGAGELVINSIDMDGVRDGFDIELLNEITRCVSIPIIASGGAGNMGHFAALFQNTTVDAGLAASIFHSGEVRINELIEYLRGSGIPVKGAA
jgi:cyclase